MPRKTENRRRLLRALHVLGLADERLLAPLLVREEYGRFAVHQALKRLRKAQLVRTIPKRIPLTRTMNIVAPNVYLLSPKGAAELGLPAKQQTHLQNRYEALRSSKQSYRLMHDLDISVVHAALLRGHEAGVLRLTEWMQGEDTEIAVPSLPTWMRHRPPGSLV